VARYLCPAQYSTCDSCVPRFKFPLPRKTIPDTSLEIPCSLRRGQRRSECRFDLRRRCRCRNMGLIQVYALDLGLLRHRSASFLSEKRVAIDLSRAMTRTVGRDVASCAKPTIAALKQRASAPSWAQARLSQLGIRGAARNCGTLALACCRANSSGRFPLFPG
jgi:hypothetical protein